MVEPGFDYFFHITRVKTRTRFNVSQGLGPSPTCVCALITAWTFATRAESGRSHDVTLGAICRISKAGKTCAAKWSRTLHVLC